MDVINWDKIYDVSRFSFSICFFTQLDVADENLAAHISKTDSEA